MATFSKNDKHHALVMFGTGLGIGLLAAVLAFCSSLGDVGRELMRWLELILVAWSFLAAYLLCKPVKGAEPVKVEGPTPNSKDWYNFKMAFVFMLGLTALAMLIDTNKRAADLLMMAGGALGGLALSRINPPSLIQAKIESSTEGAPPQ